MAGIKKKTSETSEDEKLTELIEKIKESVKGQPLHRAKLAMKLALERITNNAIVS